MTPSLYQQLNDTRIVHARLWREVAAGHKDPRDQHTAVTELRSLADKIIQLEKHIAEQQGLIDHAYGLLVRIGATPATRMTANARTRIEEGLLWLTAELGTPPLELADTSQIIGETLDKLFTNGSGETAQRLVMVDGSNRDLGGYCREAVGGILQATIGLTELS